MKHEPKSAAQMLKLEAELARRGLHWGQGPFSSYENTETGRMMDPLADADWRGFLAFLHGWIKAPAPDEIERLRAEVARLTTELTVANNRLGNAVGAIIDAGNHYCTGPADVADAIYRLTTETEQLRAAREASFDWWYACWRIAEELDLSRRRFGQANYDMTDDHCYELAFSTAEAIETWRAGGLLQDGDPT